MTNHTRELCERLCRAEDYALDCGLETDDSRLLRQARMRIETLEAICAQLEASLDQSEREVENLRHDIDLYQEITKAEVERGAELQAQITSANDAWMELYGALTKRYEELEAQLAAIQNQEPVDWQTRYVGDPRQPGFWERTANPEYAKRIYTENADHTANGWETRPVYAHPLAEAASDYVLSLLVTAGHVSQEKVDEAREIARKTPGVAATSIPVAIVKADHDGTKHAILRDETVADGTLLYAGASEGAVRFAGLILKAHRNDGYPGDVDGDVLQRAALDCGLLEERTVAEPCGERCSCAETLSESEFPTICYFITEAGKAAVAAAKEQS
jgi:hypothetical protein